jgi:hypothetical protein
MLLYQINSQSDTIVTLTESTTLTSPYYLFVFTNVSTKVQYKINVNSTSDASLFKDRFNEFAFNTITLFASAQAGQFSYEVYEQSSSTNLDPSGLNLVECGKMLLQPENNLIKNGYAPTTTYKGYGG